MSQGTGSWYSSERMAVRAFMPHGWRAAPVSDDMVALVPGEIADQDVRSAPIAVLLCSRRVEGGPESLQDTVRKLMSHRVKQGEVVPAGETGEPKELSVQWTDGILRMISRFIATPEGCTEVIYAIKPVAKIEQDLGWLVETVKVEVL